RHFSQVLLHWANPEGFLGLHGHLREARAGWQINTAAASQLACEGRRARRTSPDRHARADERQHMRALAAQKLTQMLDGHAAKARADRVPPRPSSAHIRGPATPTPEQRASE